MVKNNGGNKAKKIASKSFNISDRATRYATMIIIGSHFGANTNIHLINT